MLTPALLPSHKAMLAVPASATHKAVDAAVHKLSQQLRKLTGLSLEVVSTQAFGAAARHTDCVPVPLHPLLRSTLPKRLDSEVLRCVDPVHVLVRRLPIP